MKIILATSSPYRIQAMKFSGMPFQAVSSNVEEKFESRPDDPKELVKLLSRLKAEAVKEKFERDNPNSIIIGFDSVGYFKGNILEKPSSKQEAFERLRALSEKRHDFFTGITLINTKTKKITQEVIKTIIGFRKISNIEIEKYLSEDKNYNTYATGYDPLANIRRPCKYPEGHTHIKSN